MSLVAITAGVTLQLKSANHHLKWTLGDGYPVAISFGKTNVFNSTILDYTVVMQDETGLAQSGLYVNTTFASGPPHIVYSLNGTAGTHWANGPFALPAQGTLTVDFQLRYNGTIGFYDFIVNVVG